MICEIKYFGMIAEKLGETKNQIDLTKDIVDHNDLIKSIKIMHPEIANLTFKIAVDGEISNNITSEGARTIAVLPPFAGG